MNFYKIQVKIPEIYSILNLKIYNQHKIRLQHTITIYKTLISLYRPLKTDQARKWLRKGKKLKFAIVAHIYGPKVMMICVIDLTEFIIINYWDKNRLSHD